MHAEVGWRWGGGGAGKLLHLWLQSWGGWVVASACPAPHTSHLTLHTSHLTPHTSLLTPHASCLTPHTSQPTPITSTPTHLNRHASLPAPHNPHLSHLTFATRFPGTHVASTAELQLIKVAGVERTRGLVRVRFVSGGRAVAAMGRCLTREVAITARLTAPPAEHVKAVEALVKVHGTRVKGG